MIRAYKLGRKSNRYNIFDWWNPSNGGGQYSAEAQAVFNNMTQPLTTREKDGIATFVDTLVAAGLYNSNIIDFVFKGLGNQDNSFTSFKNVANPVNNGADWNSYEGVTTDGSSSYIDIGFIPNNNADFELNNCGMGVYVRVNQSQAAIPNTLFGCLEAASNTRQLLLQQTGSGGTTIIGRVNVGNSNITYGSDNIFDNQSFYAVDRTASNISRIIKDSTVLATSATASSAKAQISPFIGARNTDGSPNVFLKASFKYSVLFKPVGFNYDVFNAAANQLIADLEYPILHMLVIGDSIARGTSNGTTSATEHTLKEFNGTKLVDISGDVAEAATGSPYPSFADRLFTISERVTHIVDCGEGGSDFSPNGDTNNWSTSGTRYALMKTKANNYLTTQLPGTKFDIIRITLGINDARGSADLTTINTDAISLIDRLNTDFPGSKILINQIGKGVPDADREASVRATIDNLVTTYENVYAGTDLNTYPVDAFYDGLHLNQTYNNQLGVDDANIVNGLL